MFHSPDKILSCLGLEFVCISNSNGILNLYSPFRVYRTESIIPEGLIRILVHNYSTLLLLEFNRHRRLQKHLNSLLLFPYICLNQENID